MRIRRSLVVAGLVALIASPLVVPVLAHGNIVNADHQRIPDGTVLAESVYVLEDAWLVVHRDDDGSVGEPIGHTAIAPSRLQTAVPVSIDDGVWSSWNGSRTVHLALHHDDGDGTFSPADDEILSTADVRATTTITVERADKRAYVHAARIDRIETNGSVPIRAAALPTDGFVVLESPSGDRTVGHVALSAGTHENESVRIDEPYYRHQQTWFAVRAVIYRDDGSGEFDEADSPVTAGTQAVGTTVELERTDNRTPTGDTPTESGEHDDENHEHDDGHEHETTAPATPSPPTQTAGSNGAGFGLLLSLVAVLVVALRVASRREP